ncbi:hypothetical protein FACS189421_04910 [Bacteroidia bacterium]|nr:hypothetical protein FACS189421_04910 [Bacteroidia bacterium]GHT02889.1 hypothetical protein FACS189423_02520 [Bacteroidia bacterium]
MRKLIFCLLISLSVTGKSFACGDYDPDEGYFYNLFAQEIIDDPQYYSFLLSYGGRYYSSGEQKPVPNENIEEWQTYIGLNYEDTYYLVFKATREEVKKLIDGKPVTDEKLQFANAAWVRKNKQALLYLAYAKYLEPYMSVQITDGWYYGDEKSQSVADLDYAKVMNVLERSWKAETDDELKLRYGYQLVRLAHYNKRYKDAIHYFDSYVEALNYKPAMYYYALNQKAGAQRGLGEVTEANYNFFTVFTHSKNLKENALSSIRFTEDADFKAFLKKAKSPNEINDAYLLLGFLSFSDPLPEMEKITASTPDAIQAKVLMARAINLIERTYNLSYANWSDNCIGQDKRYPLTCLGNEEIGRFFQRVLAFSQEMANLPAVKEKDFWNLTASYLNFIHKDFANAKSYLEKVEAKNAKYKNQKQNLAMYIDISEQAKITNEIETAFYTKYQNAFNYQPGDYHAGMDADPSNVSGFVIDVLANRYFLQKDYAKSFLLNNNIMRLEDNPDEEMLTAIEAFYHKPNKNAMEKSIAKNLLPGGVTNNADIQQYIDYLWGNIYLAKGELEKSLQAFQKIKKDNYRGFSGIPNEIFGYNRIECFDCSVEDVMRTDYLSDFPFIKSTMNRKELVEALLQLQEIGQKKDETGAKANYLTGNFFYNVSRTGYYRHILRFDQTNGAHFIKFDSYGKKKDIDDGFYFKDYPVYYENQATLSAGYLEKAYTQAEENELKARIVFALSKCEQEVYYDTQEITYYWGENNSDGILISGRKYFAELNKYKGTHFYQEVTTNCKYFDYYVNLMD